jgi:hypothetical protein
MRPGRGKLMRARRKRGRCSCPGASHSNCEVTQDIRQPVTRDADRRDVEKDIYEFELEMEDTFNGEQP